MPYDGVGNFVISDTFYPFQRDQIAYDSSMVNILDDIANALSHVVHTDGQSKITQDISMNGHRVRDIVNPNNLNDAANLASVMSNLGKWVSTLGGSANAITLTPSPSPSILLPGHQFWFIASFSNTGATTVTVGGAGTKNITKGANIALAAGDIVGNGLTGIVYDGTQFRLIGK